MWVGSSKRCTKVKTTALRYFQKAGKLSRGLRVRQRNRGPTLWYISSVRFQIIKEFKGKLCCKQPELQCLKLSSVLLRWSVFLYPCELC